MKGGPLFLIGLVLVVLTGLIHLYSWFMLNQVCVGHLKRAANANTVAMAIPEMEEALAYIETRGWTEGYTSLIIKTPDEDLGFWYQNLKSSLEELKTVTDTTSSLTTSNMLMKLKETLVDHGGESGTDVTHPSGLEKYPYNWVFFLLYFFGFLGVVIGGALVKAD